jgi:hypothetical protein
MIRASTIAILEEELDRRDAEIDRLRARATNIAREMSIVYYALVEARRELEAYEETMTGKRYNSTKINDAITLLEGGLCDISKT